MSATTIRKTARDTMKRTDQLKVGDRITVPVEDVPFPGICIGSVTRIDPPKFGAIHFIVSNRDGSTQVIAADHWQFKVKSL